MKNATIFLSIALIGLIGNSCSKNEAPSTKPTTIIGKWVLSEIYGNDYWGGAPYWKTVGTKTKIEFTQDGKYFRKYSTDSAYSFVGIFTKTSDSTIRIIRDNPIDQSSRTYILNFSFSNDGYMTLGIFGTEALMKEKFRLDN